MNDRFKFRAWDNKENCFHTDYPSYIFSKYSWNKKRFTIEQCTGLKDKNGKFIYEGDIVEVTNLTKTYLLKTPIIWEEDIGAFMVWGNKEKTYGNYIGALMEEDDDGVIPYLVRVIGNIHENPELLEQ